MVSRKSERLMNLVISLLVARHFVPKQRIRQLVEDYRELSPEAFEKMFERDKDELRDLGIPIELGTVAAGFEDELGYRIHRSEFELPPLSFSAEEAAVIGLAARVWQHASLAESTSRALVKLGAAGVETDTEPLGALEPRLPAGEGAFAPLWNAVRTRTVVGFDYRRPGTAGPQWRTLEPWGVLNWHGRWYVVGHDRDREATRMFRLSRIVGQVGTTAGPEAFVVPDDVDIRAEAKRLDPPERREIARLRVRPGTANGLRRRAVSVTTEGGAEDWDVLEVSYGDTRALVEELSSYAADVVVSEPEDLRTAVVEHLRRLLAHASPANPVGDAVRTGTPGGHQ